VEALEVLLGGAQGEDGSESCQEASERPDLPHVPRLELADAEDLILRRGDGEHEVVPRLLDQLSAPEEDATLDQVDRPWG